MWNTTPCDVSASFGRSLWDERRRRDRYLAWGVSPRNQENKRINEPLEGATDTGRGIYPAPTNIYPLDVTYLVLYSSCRRSGIDGSFPADGIGATVFPSFVNRSMSLHQPSTSRT